MSSKPDAFQPHKNLPNESNINQYPIFIIQPLLIIKYVRRPLIKTCQTRWCHIRVRPAHKTRKPCIHLSDQLLLDPQRRPAAYS